MDFKYPRTYHLPWSQSLTDDDKRIQSLDSFVGQRVVVTEKRDGENCTLRPDKQHARSVDSNHHFTRDWVRAFWATIKNDIPDGWRICGENLFARHAIGYSDLETFFEGFSVWNSENFSLSWDETQEWFALLGIKSVPVIYDGTWNRDLIHAAYDAYARAMGREIEGYVVRLASSFHYDQFSTKVAKFVRAGHVQPNQGHWLYGSGKIEQNTLKATA